MNLRIIPQVSPKEAIIYEGEEAILKLKEFGIRFEDVELATKGAIQEFNKLPKYAYSNEKNTKFFFSIIRGFREEVLPRGWSYDDSFLLNKTLPPNKKNAFIFSSGDKNVCNANIEPMTKNKKGEVSLAVVEMNNSVQLNFLNDLFPDNQIIPDKYDIGTFPHWFFLFSRFKNEVKIELSLPEGIDKKTRKISKWSERIILPIIKLEDSLPVEDAPPKEPCYNKEDSLNITRKI